MDNVYYILSQKQINIKRLHICTWESPHEASYIEFGLEFSYDSFWNNSIIFYLYAPLVKKTSTVTCLLKNISDMDNGRFIFNDVVRGVDTVGEDSRDGSILKFEKRDNLTVLPCKIGVNDRQLTLEVKKPKRYEGNLYFRVLVKLDKSTIAIKKTGIAQTTYTYDLKINETRNLPQDVYDLKKDKHLKLCKVKKLFCLHAVPDNFTVSFVNTTKLKNIRKLESTAFQRYLPEIKDINKDCYNIIFLKDDDSDGKESYSLFSICTEETIGSEQIALAVGANILCSLLFAIYSFRINLRDNIAWYIQTPWEGIFAILVLICLVFYLFSSMKKRK